MADQNCSHHGCSCKVEQGKGVSGARIHTAVITALMLDRPPRENASVGTQTVGKLTGRMAVRPPLSFTHTFSTFSSRGQFSSK